MIEVEKDEKIIRIVRRHWFVLLGDLFILVFAVLVPVVLLIFLHLLPIEKIFAFSGSTFAVGGFFLFAWLSIVWIMGWNIWTDYYLDILMITDKRVFDINQDGLFHSKSASFRIDRIQNVTVDQEGIIQTLFDFGGIRIETAGGIEDFVANYIAKPYEIKKLINEMQDVTLDKSQEVHLHPDTLERIAPGSTEVETGKPATSSSPPTSGNDQLSNKQGV